MRNRLLGILFCITLFASCASFVHTSPHASADMICYTVSQPPPAGVYGLTVPPCTAITAAPTAGPTAVPGPTDANGIPLVHPTALPTQTIQGCTGCVAVPVSIATSLAIIPAQVNACNVGFTACSNVGTTVADGYSDLLESLFSTGFMYTFNGASWDRGRNAGIGNGVPATGIQANAPYGEFLTALPTLTTGQYGDLQLDASSRLIISPTGLPTPLATQPVSGTVTVNTPAPYPTGTGGQLSVNIAAQSLSPLSVSISNNTLLQPYSSSAAQAAAANSFVGIAGFDGTNVQPVKTSTNGVLDNQICLNTGSTCANVGNLGSDGMSQGNNGLSVASYGLIYNQSTTSFDRMRSASTGNAIGATGLAIGVHYCENLTTLPTLTNATYGAAQCDTSGRLLISPTGLPTPLATQPISGTVTANAGTGTMAVSAASTGYACQLSLSSTSGSGQLISGAGTTHICFIQGTLAATATAGTYTLVYGTGSSCTSPTTFFQEMDSVATTTTQFSYLGNGGTVVVPSGLSVCLLTSGLNSAITNIMYSQP